MSHLVFSGVGLCSTSDDSVDQRHLAPVVVGRVLLLALELQGGRLGDLLHLHLLAVLLLQLASRTDGVVDVHACPLGGRQLVAVVGVQVSGIQLDDVRGLSAGDQAPDRLLVVLDVDGIVQFVHLKQKTET